MSAEKEKGPDKYTTILKEAVEALMKQVPDLQKDQLDAKVKNCTDEKPNAAADVFPQRVQAARRSFL